MVLDYVLVTVDMFHRLHLLSNGYSHMPTIAIIYK